MPRSRKSKAKAPAPSPAELERQRKAAIESRAEADYERVTGDPWSECPPGGRQERMAQAERALRSEAAAPPADPPSTPAPAPVVRALTVDDLSTFAKGMAPVIRQAIMDRTDPLTQRIKELEHQVAKLSKAASGGRSRGKR